MPPKNLRAIMRKPPMARNMKTQLSYTNIICIYLTKIQLHCISQSIQRILSSCLWGKKKEKKKSPGSSFPHLTSSVFHSHLMCYRDWTRKPTFLATQPTNLFLFFFSLPQIPTYQYSDSIFLHNKLFLCRKEATIPNSLALPKNKTMMPQITSCNHKQSQSSIYVKSSKQHQESLLEVLSPQSITPKLGSSIVIYREGIPLCLRWILL